jgi:site-specific DNA recombinase
MENINRKAVIYSRVSSKEQEREGYSIPAQIKLLREYANINNIEIVKEFSEAETAKKSGRTQFLEMVKFLKLEQKRKTDNICNIILVEKTDRLYRNFKDYVTLDEIKLELHFVKENQILSETSRSNDKFLHGIKVLMAKNYIDNLSEEVKKGMLQKAEEGIYPNHAPYGYINIKENGKNIIVPDPDTKDSVEKIFNLFQTGNYTIRGLSDKLFELGYSYKKPEKKIPKTTINRILRSPLYYGSFTFREKLYKGQHEPIISKIIFDRVQAILDDHRDGEMYQRKHKWQYQGLVKCGYCGCTYTVESKRAKYVYYHCTNGKGNCTNRKYVKEEILDMGFAELIDSIKIDEKLHELLVNALRDSSNMEIEEQDKIVNKLNEDHIKLQNRINALYIDKLDGIITEEQFNRLNTEWKDEQNDILKKINSYDKADFSYKQLGANLIELSQSLSRYYLKANFEEKRQILRILLSNTFWKDGKLIFTLRKPFDMLVDTTDLESKKRVVNFTINNSCPIWRERRDSNSRPPA